MSDEKKPTIWDELSAPFHYSDVKYRIQALNGNSALLLPYVDSRAVQRRLDNILGVDGWEDQYEEWQSPTVPMDSATAIAGGYRSWWSAGKKQGEHDPGLAAELIQSHYQKSVKCTLRCRESKKADWITKVGLSDNSDIEGVKGGESGSLRRAAVKFGIGRYLYDLKDIWVTVVTGNRPDGEGWEWTRSGKIDVYYHKPDLRNFGAGDPGGNDNETIPVTLGKPQTPGESKMTPQGSAAVTGSGGQSTDLFGAPSAIPPAEMNDYLARVSALIQNNADSLKMYREIDTVSSFIDKVSKLIGCLYFVAAQRVPGGQHFNAIQKAGTEKKFGDMLSVLKTVLADMEAGIYK